MQQANQAYHSEINDLLLTALAYSLEDWNSNHIQGITLEGHGREDINRELNINHTVGWFTSMYPVKLELSANLADSIKQIKENLRNIPHKGIGFGSFAQSSESGLSFQQLPKISFNYLGQFDSQDSYWQISDESSGISMDQANRDHNLININGMVIAGELRFSIVSYLDEASTNQLSQSFKSRLEQIIVHCKGLVDKKISYYTPSDFANITSESHLSTLPIPINNSDSAEPFEMTELQKAYLLGRTSYFEIGNVSNHTYQEYAYLKPIDIEQLQIALNKLIHHYPELRTVFDAHTLKQHYISAKDVGVYDVEVATYDCDYDDSIIAHVRDDYSHKVYDTTHYPLFSFFVSRFKNRDILHISVDLIILDGDSRAQLFYYLNCLYQDNNFILASNEVSFKNYQDYICQLKNSSWYQRDYSYWQNKLLQLPLRPIFNFNSDPWAVKNPVFAINYRVVEKDKWSKFKEQCAVHMVSPSSVLLFLYGYVLSQYSQNAEFLITLTVFNRMNVHQDIDKTWGNFTSTSLFGFNNTGNSIIEKVKNTHDNLWDDLEHKLFSGIEVQRLLQQEHGLNIQHAVSPIVFTGKIGGKNKYAQNTTFLSSSEIVNERYWRGQTSQAWIDLQAIETDDEFSSGWLYVTQLFDAELIERLNANYCNLIEFLGESNWNEVLPTIALSKLDQEIINQANSHNSATTNETMIELFNKALVKYPENTAIIDVNGKYSYTQIYADSCGISYYLQEHNLCKANTLIGVLSQKGYQQVVAVLGIMQSGAAYLPLHIDWPLGRCDEVLCEGQVTTVLLSREEYDSCIKNSELFSKYTWLIIEDIINHQVDDARTHSFAMTKPRADDIAYVIFTSGSTGKPKGVTISHHGAVNTLLAINERFEINSQDSVLALSELSFDLSVYDIFGVLAAGGTVVFPEQSKTKEPSHWYELVNEHQITIWNTVPQLMSLLLDYANDRDKRISSLKVCLLSGDWLPLNLATQINKHNPQTIVMSLGGATEGSIWSIWYEIKDVMPEWKSIPYGVAMPNQKMYILNQNGGHNSVGVIGEIHIGGCGVALGYWNDQEKTQASFIEHPSLGRLYKTGDLGRWDKNGYMVFEGRKDHQVKLNGYRVELEEISFRLNQINGVENALITVQDNHIIGYLVLTHRNDQQAKELVTTDYISDVLKQHLPEYMLPNTYIIIDEIPLTANGKVDYKALPKVDYDTQSNYVAPSSELEQTLCQIWSGVLGIDVDKLGVNDDFFRIGGNSILAIKLAHQISKSLDQDISVADIFKHKTILGSVSNLKLMSSVGNFEGEL
ncbi:MAG: amino acid adenylation domain-containing protein [Burkholderiales bacterium]|nr:amino acid adenylation domain-containing protein [Burkholderiales bacterium]